MSNALVQLFGWKATLLHGDPSVYDRWRWLRRHLRAGPQVRTFDAGCGSGAYTLYAARLGNDCYGLSFDEGNQRKAAARAQILGLGNARFGVGDLRALDRIAPDLGHFDQIICCETIEHILNDRKLLADLSSLLAPGGRLLLTTPYRHYRPLLGDRVSEVEDGSHVRWGYTHEEMRSLFAEAGLRVVAEEYISGIVTQRLMNLMRRLSAVSAGMAWALTMPLRALAVADEALTRATGYPYLSIGVVGVKEGGSPDAARA